VAAAILAVYWVALAWQAWHVGLTFDEPTHLVGGYLYWLNRPDLFPEDLPPLTKILDGWVPLALDIPLFPELEVWQNGWKQDVASAIIDGLPARRIHEVFYLMRLMRTVLALLLALLIWQWGRELFGETVALLLLLVSVLSPTTLAHGHLIKSDVASALTYLWFVYRAWHFWRRPGTRASLLLGLSVLLALLAKMSMLIVAPLAVLLVFFRLIRPPRAWFPTALAAVILIPYLGLLAAYKFEVRRLTAQDLTEMRDHEEFSRPLLIAAQVFRAIPTPTHIQKAVRSLNFYSRYGAPSYMLGEARSRGHWAYYLLALAVKIPISIQILFLAGLLVAALRRERPALVLLLPALLYLGFAGQSDLQLGVRLVLPSLPFAILLGGYAVRQALEARRGQLALLALLGWLAGASAFIYPHGIAYFNEWAGGPSHGREYLVDSNLDWGQNLPDLAHYLHRHGIPRIKLYYFGFDKLHHWGLENRVELLAPPWNAQLVDGPRPKLEPGYYGVSATLLPGHLFAEEFRGYFAQFNRMTPVAHAGYGILIFFLQ
jgi:hypothetical protein